MNNQSNGKTVAIVLLSIFAFLCIIGIVVLLFINNFSVKTANEYSANMVNIEKTNVALQQELAKPTATCPVCVIPTQKPTELPTATPTAQPTPTAVPVQPTPTAVPLTYATPMATAQVIVVNGTPVTSPTQVVPQVVVTVDPAAIVFGYRNDTLNVDICASLNSLPIDPSSRPWPKTDRELNRNVVEKLSGPAVIEWWYAGRLEGVWRLAAGETMELPLGTAGHYFPQTSNEDMMYTWALEVCNYSKKPEHKNKTTYGSLVINPRTAINIASFYSLH